jgi:5-methylcytosine-specific restriction endonuclease McrA
MREKFCDTYPEAVPWGRTNVSQHAAFQAMSAQYDHVLPHTRGGNNDIDNIILICAPCNYGRMSYTLEGGRVARSKGSRAPSRHVGRA